MTPERRLYGRRRGRRLRPGRQRLLAELLPRIQITLPPPDGRLDPRALFSPPVRHVWLEVGFGSGEHLALQAAAHPDVGLIGCEPYVNGVAALLAQVARQGLENVRIHPGDARLLLDALPEASVARAFVLYPDPWPKSRHAKRRFVAPANLAALARVLEDDAELRLATDDAAHLRWMLEHLMACRAFEWTARGPRDWRIRPPDWPPTRYEQKAAAEGRASTYLRFRRVARAPCR